MAAPAANVTPFIEFIQKEWMWKQIPPIVSPAAFASFIDYPKQTVYGWFKGQRPQADAVIIIANKTGLPLRKLLELNGYPIPFELPDSETKTL